MKQWYKDDLAYIHDVGFGDYALKSAPGILDILARGGINTGLVVDLGCGSGLWAQHLLRANYQVLGIDMSAPMIDIARKRAPRARFQIGSLFDVQLPPCNAVTSIGECLNYMFDSRGAGLGALRSLFRRIHHALQPNGLFVFDIAEPGQVGGGGRTRGFSEGKDWFVLVEKEEDTRRSILTRRIITLRKAGSQYSRGDEIHRQRLYKTSDISTELRLAGFRARTLRRYGQYPLPKYHAAFIGRKVE
jgi:SAM-dependent methyltransferase